MRSRDVPRISSTGVVLVAAALAFIALALLLLTSGNTASVAVYNHSQRTLENVVLAVPGRSAKFDSLKPGDVGGFPAAAARSLHVQLSFDADGEHYELDRRVDVLPIGDTIVSASVDSSMALSVEAKLLMFR